MNRYKVGVVGAQLLIGKEILKNIIAMNFPYSFIRAISYRDDQKEIVVNDYQFSLSSLTIESLKDLDLVFFVVSQVNFNKYIDYLKENNKRVILISENNCEDYLNMEATDIDKITKNQNIFVCPSINSIILSYLFDNRKLDYLEMQEYHCASENGDNGVNELSQQLHDYVSCNPLIAHYLPSLESKRIPLAFNLILFNNDEYENKLKKEVYNYFNNDFEIINNSFYIPSFFTAALVIKTKNMDKNMFLDNLNKNKDIVVYENDCPSFLDSEGNNMIHLGNIKENHDLLSFFVTYDYLKIRGTYVLKMMEKVISYD